MIELLSSEPSPEILLLVESSFPGGKLPVFKTAEDEIWEVIKLSYLSLTLFSAPICLKASSAAERLAIRELRACAQSEVEITKLALSEPGCPPLAFFTIDRDFREATMMPGRWKPSHQFVRAMVSHLDRWNTVGSQASKQIAPLKLRAKIYPVYTMTNFGIESTEYAFECTTGLWIAETALRCEEWQQLLQAKAKEAADAEDDDISTETFRRQAIPERVRNEVWRRDEGKCVDCESRANLEFDHIVPVSKGGSNTARNIELRCEPCNRSKGATI